MNGDQSATFREACVKLGLAVGDREHAACLTESADVSTGRQLRRLFVSLLITCNPAEPGQLFDDFKEVP